MYYETFNSLSTIEKDLISEGSEIEQRIQQYNENKNKNNRTQSSTLKRHPTNHSQINEEQYKNDYQNDYMDFQSTEHNRQRKKRANDDKDERTYTRTINNSNIDVNTNTHTTTAANDTIIKNKPVYISQHALDYAAEYHQQPIKIECEPKLKDQREGSKFIQAFINCIKSDFYNQNVSYNKPLLFDLWWIDKEGNIRIIVKSTEINVYLSQANRYPKQVNDIKITPYPPKHLPPQHTAIVKWVKNTISLGDLKDELKIKYNSIFLIEEIMGTINDRNRHLRIELLDKKEYNSMLDRGKISIYGQLYDIDEFLPSPKLLICTKCNQPGHVKINCRSSNFEICRRCGDDRNNKNNHKECTIKCHHCKGEHISTDYKCPFIQEYRRRLIIELRKRPDLLPPDIQLFIPSEYREQGERTKVIYNESARRHQHLTDEQRTFERNNFNVWPQITQNIDNANIEDVTTRNQQSLAEEIKTLNNELQIIKKNFEEKLCEITSNYKNHLSTIKQGWQLIQQQSETHSQILSTINITINQTLFSTCQKTLNIMFNMINKMKSGINTNDYDDMLHDITLQVSFINDMQTTYLNHQKSLEKLFNKQNDALGNMMNTLSENTNE